MKQKPSFIRSLTEEQRDHIWNVLQNHGYIETIRILALPVKEGGLNLKITKNKLERFFAERSQQELMERLPEIKQSADAWLHYKETGETTRFDEAALERLKLRAFELSGTLKDREEFIQLKGLFQILFAARHAAVRERIAAVQERAFTLRENEAKARGEREEKKTARATKKETHAPRFSDRDDTDTDTEPMPTSDTASRVIKHCGGPSGFIGQLLPGEPVGHCMRRLYKAMVAGTLPPNPKPIDWGDDEFGLPRASTLNPPAGSSTEPPSGVAAAGAPPPRDKEPQGPAASHVKGSVTACPRTPAGTQNPAIIHL